MSGGGPRFNCHRWNYGGPMMRPPGGPMGPGFGQMGPQYGQMARPPFGGQMFPPPGNYNQRPGFHHPRFRGNFRPRFRGTSGPGRGRGGTQQPPPSEESEEAEKKVPDAEEGEIVERPLSEILRGRNPIAFCNEQSKMRSLHLEWEQVSETGPPHDKIFTWSLKIGDNSVSGTGNSKKAAKNAAAEEMAKKLDLLPKTNFKRPHFHQRQQFGGGGAKKVKKETKDKAKEDAVMDNPALDNPISKLYEFAKQKHLPEPLFEVISEEVVETRKTSQGFVYKRTRFTMQCDVMGRKYIGDSTLKKKAKFNAAAAAWAEIGGGIGPDKIDSLIQDGRRKAEEKS